MFAGVSVIFNIIWYNSFSCIERYVEENDDEMRLDISREKFTKKTSQLCGIVTSDIFFCGLVNEISSCNFKT